MGKHKKKLPKNKNSNTEKSELELNIDNWLILLAEIVSSTNYTFEQLLRFTPKKLEILYKYILKNKIENYKLQILLNRVETEYLQEFGKEINKEINVDTKDNIPKKFDIREMENMTKSMPFISYKKVNLKKEGKK